MPSKKRALAAAAAVVVVAIAGWWTYSEIQTREQRRAIETALADATTRLRDSLAVAPNATSKRALPRLDGHVAALEGHLKVVRSASAVRQLADGAEHYLISTHAILKRQAASIRQSEDSAASRAALIGHMRRAARRDAAWIREAMTQKKAVEAQYFDYGLTLKALADLLFGLRDSTQRVAPFVDESLLLEVGPAEQARRLVLKESQRVADELDGVRRLAPR